MLAPASKTGGSELPLASFIKRQTDAHEILLLLCDLRQRHAGTAVLNHLLSVYIEPRSSDLASFQLRPSHSTFDTFNDNVR